MAVTAECNTFSSSRESYNSDIYRWMLSTPLLCLLRLKAIFQCQTGSYALSLHGAGRVKCEPFVCFQIDLFLWQTALDGTWLFNLCDAAATCEFTALLGFSVTHAQLLDTSAGGYFLVWQSVGLQDALFFLCVCSKGDNHVCVLWHEPSLESLKNATMIKRQLYFK